MNSLFIWAAEELNRQFIFLVLAYYIYMNLSGKCFYRKQFRNNAGAFRSLETLKTECIEDRLSTSKA